MSQDSTTTTWIERLQELSQSKQFLNKEFLTWLWYFAEQNQGPIEFTPKDLLDAPQTKKKSSFYLWIDDKIILESIHRGGQKTLQHSIKGGDPSKSPEAGLALLGGKIVKELKLGMRILPWGDFTATLNGTDLNPRSLTLPKPTDDTSQESPDPLVFRINAARLFVTALDHLVSLYLADRMQDRYEQDIVPQITALMLRKNQSQGKTSTTSSIH